MRRGMLAVCDPVEGVRDRVLLAVAAVLGVAWMAARVVADPEEVVRWLVTKAKPR